MLSLQASMYIYIESIYTYLCVAQAISGSQAGPIQIQLPDPSRAIVVLGGEAEPRDHEREHPHEAGLLGLQIMSSNLDMADTRDSTTRTDMQTVWTSLARTQPS